MEPPGTQREPALRHRTERGVCRRNRSRYVGFRMLSADEARLVCRRSQVHAALEHSVEKAVERLLVALHDLGVRRRRHGTKIQTEHASHRLRRKRNATRRDRKSTRLNSSHLVISYAVFCLKKKKQQMT